MKLDPLTSWMTSLLEAVDARGKKDGARLELGPLPTAAKLEDDEVVRSKANSVRGSLEGGVGHEYAALGVGRGPTPVGRNCREEPK